MRDTGAAADRNRVGSAASQRPANVGRTERVQPRHHGRDEPCDVLRVAFPRPAGQPPPCRNRHRLDPRSRPLRALATLGSRNPSAGDGAQPYIDRWAAVPYMRTFGRAKFAVPFRERLATLGACVRDRPLPSSAEGRLDRRADRSREDRRAQK
jgi:hypothetical protein